LFPFGEGLNRFARFFSIGGSFCSVYYKYTPYEPVSSPAEIFNVFLLQFKINSENCVFFLFFYCFHGKKDFVIPNKSGITKIFCYNYKFLVLSTKRLVAAAKFLVEATKNSFVVPNFVAVTKPFFSAIPSQQQLLLLKEKKG